MSKTFIYCLAVIALFILVIRPLSGTKDDTEKETETKKQTAEESQSSETGLNENKDENGVSQGAAGQQKYRIGLRGSTN